MVKRTAGLAYLEFFYPIHYKVGIGVEDALRDGRLTRHQVAILWLIRSEGEDGRCMRRKDIERFMCTWFEIGSSAISKALRAMTRAPTDFVTLAEDPNSGREKLVTLSPEGSRFLDEAIGRGADFITAIVERMTEAEIADGLRIFARISEIHDEVHSTATARRNARRET